MESGKGFIELGEDGLYRENLQFYDAFETENGYLFSCQKFNGLFFYDSNNNVTRQIGIFQNEKANQFDLHRCVVKKDDRLYFIPYYGHNIHITTGEGLEQDYVEIIDSNDNRPHYSNAFLRGNELWMVPFFLDCPFVRYNTETGELVKDYSIRDFILKEKVDIERMFIDIFCSDIVNDSVIFSLIGQKRLYEFSVKKSRCRIVSDGVDELSIRAIKCFGGHVYVTNVNDYGIADYCISDDKWCVYRFKKEREIVKYPFSEIIVYDNRVIALAGYFDYCAEIDVRNNELKELDIELPQSITRLSEGYALFTGVSFKGDNVILYPRGTNRMVILDSNLKCVNTRVIARNITLEDMASNGYLDETSDFQLADLIYCISID